MELRDYQQDLEMAIYLEWAKGHRNVCAQLSCGGGKTAIFTKVLKDELDYSVVIAHRMQIVCQISRTLAALGVRHNIIGSKTLIRSAITMHIADNKRSFFDPQAKCIVACVDTLVNLPPQPWMQRVKLVVQDEAHHVLRKNKWGKAAALFPNARGLYPTATPERADGYGLGRYADGVLYALVKGPPMRELIDRGYLSRYRVFAPPNDLDLSQVNISAGGDYSPEKLRMAVHDSHIMGDIVQHYLKIAPGKLGVTFAVDIDSAQQIAQAFRNAGVPAEIITSKTPELLRFSIMKRFEAREILQLVNVDLLGEGVDVPAIEVVSMGRPTESYALFVQQFCRALRPLPGKDYAIIIDHVGNTLRHGLPDANREWSLDRRERRRRNVVNDIIPVRTCLNDICMGVYEKVKRSCPYCGHTPVPAGRSLPEQVDGDLLELTPEALAKLRGEVERIDAPPRIPQHLDPVAQLAVANNHKLRQQNQEELRNSIALWAGHQKYLNYNDDEIYKLFYFRFGIDVMSAQALNSKDSIALKFLIDKSVKNV